ncbi:MAG: 23S rRNA (adenine(2503)-C(2))-methyltransferase RlmN [Paludibacteraceae bacterium]|nr:23S rRNA (adenine(2503)-C(2))-methyltransferase RlmN [Paludibacteraceae bacterium]
METLLGMTLPELQEAALSVGLPRFAGKQLAEWLYGKRVCSFEQMTNLPQKGRAALSARYRIGRSLPAAEAVSADGTKKYLFAAESPDAGGKENYIESVYIPDDERATLCVSTQAGCKMGCRFCMTGTLGFHGQLTAADILNQIFSIPDAGKLTNLVYMGEGEPCDNTDAVLRSIEVMTSAWGCAWSPRRITVSSVGWLPGLRRLLDESECQIAISLHNPFPAERAEMMPAEKKYSIEQVLGLLRQYDWHHQRRLSFEYICFGGQNDTLRHASQLRRLLSGLDCRVNLIKYHSSGASAFRPSEAEQMEWLRDYLSANGITTTIRRSRGEDILAACGMLVNSLQQHA